MPRTFLVTTRRQIKENLMLLSEGAALGPMLRTAFLVFAGFWVVVLVVLYFGIGLLLRKHERLSKGHHGEGGPTH
jgi:type VI protein secretion system component VasF